MTAPPSLWILIKLRCELRASDWGSFGQAQNQEIVWGTFRSNVESYHDLGG